MEWERNGKGDGRWRDEEASLVLEVEVVPGEADDLGRRGRRRTAVFSWVQSGVGESYPGLTYFKFRGSLR